MQIFSSSLEKLSVDYFDIDSIMPLLISYKSERLPI